jgi:ureidoglycolate hydrolase
VQLPINKLTVDAFAPFGAIVTQPASAAQASGASWQYWSGLALLPGDGVGYGVGYLHTQPCGVARFDWAERHALSYELLVAATGECIIHVAPAQYPDELDRLPPLGSFRLFRLLPGQGVVLNPKVWHGAPLAVDSPAQVLVVLRQDTGAENTCIVPFEGEALEAAV